MAYQIQKDEGVAHAVRRIAREQIEEACRQLDAPEHSHACVHAVRKRCKRLRGLLRLVRDGLGRTYRRENRAFRDTARQLSRVRDHRVILATHDRLIDEFDAAVANAGALAVRERLALISTSLQRVPAAEIARALHHARDALTRASQRVEDWRLSEDSGHVVHRGLERTYKRARKGLVRAAGSRDTADFHAWRKRVKYHWFHLRLTSSRCPVAANRAAEVRALATLLGDAHDLAIYEARLEKVIDSGHRDMVALLRLVSMGRRVALERRALDEGRALFRQRPKDFVRTLNL
jgi:CHAD domain-containing protein